MVFSFIIIDMCDIINPIGLISRRDEVVLIH